MNVFILPAVTLALRMTSIQLAVLILQLDGGHVACAVGTDASANCMVLSMSHAPVGVPAIIHKCDCNLPILPRLRRPVGLARGCELRSRSIQTDTICMYGNIEGLALEPTQDDTYPRVATNCHDTASGNGPCMAG